MKMSYLYIIKNQKSYNQKSYNQKSYNPLNSP